MKIGIVGTGNMGRTLGLALLENGHDVFFGARDMEKARAAADLGTNAHFGTNQEAAEFGEVIYFNPRDVAPQEVLSDVGVLNGKVVLESNNSEVPDDFAYNPVILSRSETLQAQIPNARIVKAFNTMAQEVIETDKASLARSQVACFIAGDDEAARGIVGELARDIGFQPIDCGDLRQARLLESAADLIRYLIITQKNAGVTFAIPTVETPQASRFGGRQASNLS